MSGLTIPDMTRIVEANGLKAVGVDIDLDTMIRHGKAVMRRRETALVVIDLPAGSYEDSPQQALANARHVIDETGAHGVKLEGGVAMQEHVQAITDSGIPVMGHIGLLPQQTESVRQFRITGKTDEEATQLIHDCAALVGAGAFSIVMEGMIEPVASAVAAACPVPSIGIGASPACDGQILVTEDMLGMFDAYIPKFVRKFANLKPDIAAAAKAYQQAVVSGEFPKPNHLYYREGARKT